MTTIHCVIFASERKTPRPTASGFPSIRYPLSASKARGMSLVAALFLIVVIAALGAFAVRIGMGQQQTVNLSLLGSRAMAAANAGIEWSAARAFDDTAPNCSNGTLTLTQGALSGFAVDVTCESVAYPGEGTLFVIEAVSRFGSYGQPDYASRRVRARFFE
jgi:MSHA biogenesis protein MshP